MHRYDSAPVFAHRISPDVRMAVYCTALRQGTEKEWKFLWERYLNTHNLDHKETIKSALSCTQVPEMIKRYVSVGIIFKLVLLKTGLVFRIV